MYVHWMIDLSRYFIPTEKKLIKNKWYDKHQSYILYFETKISGKPILWLRNVEGRLLEISHANTVLGH